MTLNGHRGAFLLLFGFVFALIGLSYCTAEPGAAVRHSMSWMPWWSPIWACGLLWVGAAIIAIACAFRPIPADRFGFQALSAICAGWVVAYLIAWGVGTASRGWVSAVVFGCLGGAVLVVSGMPNPVRARS